MYSGAKLHWEPCRKDNSLLFHIDLYKGRGQRHYRDLSIHINYFPDIASHLVIETRWWPDLDVSQHDDPQIERFSSVSELIYELRKENLPKKALRWLEGIGQRFESLREKVLAEDSSL